MRYLIILLGFLTIALIGCSGSSDLSITPEDHLELDEIPTISNLPVVVEDRFPDGVPSSGSGVLGLFELRLDKEKTSAELISLRISELTDVLEIVDITNFLQLAPCTDCVKIRSVALDSDQHLVLSIGVKHPFPAGDPFKPISGRNRADLHVFNVEGTVISNAVAASFPGTGASIAGFRLLSADGYSSYLDGVIDGIYSTDATIHPYVLHFDDYSAGNFSPSNPSGFASVTNPAPSGNLVMPMGCDYNFQDYIFDFPGDSIDFIYAVGCTYAVSSASKAMRFTPEYRIPQHNKKAASEVRVEISRNELRGEDNTSSADMIIKVLDISHGVATGSNLDQMFADSSVGSISVEIPGITASPVVINSPVPTGGNGRDPANPLTFNATVNNTAAGVEGNYTGLVKVTDTYPHGLNTSPLLNGMDGIERVSPIQNPLEGLFDIPEFATYATFEISVAPGTIFPTACFTTIPAGNPDLNIPTCSTVQFDATCSTDDSAVVFYEWDFDWDGNPANFSDDTAGANQVTLTKFLGVDGTFNVALRVTDDEVPGQTDIVSIMVNVSGGGNSAITDNLTTTVNLDRKSFIDMIGTYGNWVYVLNRGSYNGDDGLWLYRSCALGDGWFAPIQVSSGSSDNTPRACALDVTSDGRPVVGWIDAENDVCISIASDETATTWSTRQEVEGNFSDCPNVDVACHPSNPNYAIISFIRYDVPGGYPQEIHSRWTDNLLSGSPVWNMCGSGTYLGYWTIWNVQEVNSEFTTNGELDQVVWRLWPATPIGNQVYHRRWTPGGAYGTWSACCGYVNTADNDKIKSAADLLVDSMNRPVVVYAQSGTTTGSSLQPPVSLFINRGTDESRPIFPSPVVISTNATGIIDKPSITQDPNTGNYWIVYNYYDDNPATPSQIYRAIVDQNLSVIDFDLLWNDNDSANAYEDKYPHITFASDIGLERMITVWYNNQTYPNIKHKLSDL